MAKKTHETKAEGAAKAKDADSTRCRGKVAVVVANVVDEWKVGFRWFKPVTPSYIAVINTTCCVHCHRLQKRKGKSEARISFFALTKTRTKIGTTEVPSASIEIPSGNGMDINNSNLTFGIHPFYIEKRYEPKRLQVTKEGNSYVGLNLNRTPLLMTTRNSSKKDNLSMSNSFSALNEEEEDVENVYDESANLIQNTKAGGSSSFTAAAG
ncbi:hypothetical protein Tco_0348436 [Tanacetum coccineum]